MKSRLRPLFPRARAAWTSTSLLVIAGLWLASIGNIALWESLYALPELGGRGLWVFAGFALLLGTALVAVFVFLGALFSWRYTFKPFVIVSLIVAAVCGYFMSAYSVVIDRTMLINALQTDTKESFELMNWRMAVFVLVIGVLPAVWVWRAPVAYPAIKAALTRNALGFFVGLLATVGLVWLGFQSISTISRTHPQIRHTVTPFNAYAGALGIAFVKAPKAAQPLQAIATDAKLLDKQGKPPLLILVVGETARADRFSLNGYVRNTNPKLSTETVASFTNAWSCGTNTAASVPCMFSSLGKSAYESSEQRLEGLLHVINRAGLGVAWVDNQAGCKGVCENIPTVEINSTPQGKTCAGGECRDPAMLSYLDAQLAAMSAAQRAKGVVLVMHQMGSHGPAYYKRTDAAHKLFKPECETNALQQCELSAVNNTYDNTIVATDDFLYQSIQWLKARPDYATAMVYVSDHGESLGENGVFLHGLPYSFAPDVQKRVPWISWFSDAFTQRGGASAACIAAQRDAKISHDHYFHSVLGLLGIQTAAYKADLDAYARCYK